MESKWKANGKETWDCTMAEDVTVK